MIHEPYALPIAFARSYESFVLSEMENPSEGRVNNADWASCWVGLMMRKTVRRQNKRSSMHETCEVFSRSAGELRRFKSRGGPRVHRQTEECCAGGILLF